MLLALLNYFIDVFHMWQVVVRDTGSIANYQISVGATDGHCAIHNVSAAKLIHLPVFESLDALVGFFGDPANHHIIKCTLTACVPPPTDRSSARGPAATKDRKNRETICTYQPRSLAPLHRVFKCSGSLRFLLDWLTLLR